MEQLLSKGNDMSAEKEHFETLYKSKTVEELLSIHEQGALTDLAYAILENELTTRGEKIPDRPPEPIIVETPTPTWFRIGAFLMALLLMQFFWVAILKPIVGGGFIPQAIFTLLPSIFLWRKLFPKRPRHENQNASGTNKNP